MITVYIVLASMFLLVGIFVYTVSRDVVDVIMAWELMIAIIFAGFLIRFGMYTFEQAIKWGTVNFLWGGFH